MTGHLTPVARALAVVCVLNLLPSAHAVRKKPRRALRKDPLIVRPSAGIEARVRLEIETADSILGNLNRENALKSPYVVSAVYYRDGFLARFPEDQADADPSRRVIAHVVRAFNSENKAHFISILHELWEEKAPREQAGRFLAPVRFAPLRAKQPRRQHRYAIDLFSPEGGPVRSSSPGIVLLAEGNWQRSDPLSSSSREGGNTVIVFDPDLDRFYRYCHLGSVAVQPGSLVESGSLLGTVGHTGLNASRHGHGRHLHFEVNQFEDGKMRPLGYAELRELLLTSGSETGCCNRQSTPAARAFP